MELTPRAVELITERLQSAEHAVGHARERVIRAGADLDEADRALIDATEEAAVWSALLHPEGPNEAS